MRKPGLNLSGINPNQNTPAYEKPGLSEQARGIYARALFAAAARHVGASLEYMADSPILRDHVTKI